MAACSRCATQLQPNATVCLSCGLALESPSIPLAPPAVPTVPVVPAPVMPPVENPWRAKADAERAAGTSEVVAPARYGVPQPVERPETPIMPPNPFAKGAQTDRGPLPPQMPVRHESASIPVAFAQFSEPEPTHEASTADPAEVVVLHRESLAEALEAALAELPEDAPEHAAEHPTGESRSFGIEYDAGPANPEPFPEVLSVAPPKAAMPGWS
jgi:hypothetical protein